METLNLLVLASHIVLGVLVHSPILSACKYSYLQTRLFYGNGGVLFNQFELYEVKLITVWSSITTASYERSNVYDQQFVRRLYASTVL